MNHTEPGQIAFEAYAATVGGRTHDGRTIPSWENLTPEVRAGWIAAATAANGAPVTHTRQVLLEVLNERERQVFSEGWTRPRDDTQADGSLAAAAIAYALTATRAPVSTTHVWPKHWSSAWFKPSTVRRNLIKALALLTAEVERLDRAQRVQQP